MTWINIRSECRPEKNAFDTSATLYKWLIVSPGFFRPVNGQVNRASATRYTLVRLPAGLNQELLVFTASRTDVQL